MDANKTETDNKDKIFLASENTAEENENFKNIGQSFLHFLARNYINVNKVYAVLGILSAVSLMLANLLVTPLLNLFAFLNVNSDDLYMPYFWHGLHSKLPGATLLIPAVLIGIVYIALFVYVWKIARYADKKALLCALLVWEIIMGRGFISILLPVAALASKVLALYYYRDLSIEQQLKDTEAEFRSWFTAFKK
ncbi:hypothetical protein [Amygdalobacter nucleatus]|uniref:Uncharacterized protein n=1 Tax=Amygdalobacter nucleatus TaxID=3029274 RepID=A0A133YCQ6_9FIRM|nr:hypothetical protein [Amygdalobacter nucleatus]KXB40993.1 hypothetical protein HMPREF1872_00771 [Amygdalobacter nucleatus]MDF0485875.1 hypothetical protein [Amygdalobacter nucleatus]